MNALKSEIALLEKELNELKTLIEETIMIDQKKFENKNITAVIKNINIAYDRLSSLD